MKKAVLLAIVAGLATFVRAEEKSSAWARCTYDGTEVLFTNRAANGGASFDFSAFTNATIRFADGEIAVDTLTFDSACGLTFVGGGNTVLKGVADKSVFSGSGDGTVVWSNLTFTCDAAVRPVWRNGGAIAIWGGGFVLADCMFTNCFSEEFGGAVCAPLLTLDSTITDCVFDGSWVSAWNGYGGAIYVSAAEDGRTLTVADSVFVGNDAVNGGAICTVRAAEDQEVPIAIAVSASRFEDNAADYGGGAIFAEGAVSVAGAAEGETASAFTGNVAGREGGAICVSGIDGVSVPVAITVGTGAAFIDNMVLNAVTWTAGGAIAVLTEGCTLDVSGALFMTNRAVSTFSSGTTFGGAVYAANGCTNRFFKAYFAGNEIWAGANACYGGALSLSTGRQTIDTCVFDCREGVMNAITYGGAVDLDTSDDVLILNSSFRFAAVEAISGYAVGNVAVSNCVVVGNGLIGGDIPDIYLQECGPAALAYTAYGSLYADAALASDEFNLPDRTTDIYAGDDTLKLCATNFNPAAALGLVQPGVTDFEGVPYGSCPRGSSMGAYETPTLPLVVTIDGSKFYDGNATSNGCIWTWTPAEFRARFAITNWVFGSSDVGYYASTNATAETRIVAGVAGLDARAEWLRTALEFIYTGTIWAAPSSDVILILDPAEYAWTGGEISPTNDPAGGVTVVVSNTITGAILVRDTDYVLGWADNVDPTDAAHLTVSGINNYDGVLIVSNYLITAYCTKYFKEVNTEHPVPYEVVTNGTLSGSNVVAAIDVPAGYCLDWQWPWQSGHDTNGVAYVFGKGGDGKEDILTLYVDYEKDVNVPGGDGIPDKYQERVVFAIVNGWWNGERNGADKIGWVTLTNSVGAWAVDGTGLLGDVPGVGDKPFSGHVTGEENGAWNQDLSVVIDRSTFPIFLFNYGYDKPPVNPDRGDKPFQLMSSAAEVKSGTGLKNIVSITDFRVDGSDAVSGSMEAAVLEEATGKTLATATLGGRNITIYGTDRLGGEWKLLSNQCMDEDGNWSISRLRSAKFFKGVFGD